MLIVLADFANHFVAIEGGAKCQEDMTRSMESAEPINDIERFHFRPRSLHKVDYLFDRFVVIRKRVKNEPIVKIEWFRF